MGIMWELPDKRRFENLNFCAKVSTLEFCNYDAVVLNSFATDYLRHSK